MTPEPGRSAEARGARAELTDELGEIADSLFNEPDDSAQPASPPPPLPPAPPSPLAPVAPPVDPALRVQRARRRGPSLRRWPGSRRFAELVGDGLLLGGGAALLASLFLSWSHQFTPAMLSRFGSSPALQGIPRDPDAWQVYAVAGVGLALLAGAFWLLAAVGGRRARLLGVALAAVAMAFTLHAMAVPPTNGADLVSGTLSPVGYFRDSPRSGPGELVALAGLGAALLGVALGLAADR